MNKQIITYSILTSEGQATLAFALFEMIDGRVIMTPCDANGNVIEAEASS